MYIPQLTLHHEIHEFVGGIPVPKEYNAKDALQQLRLLDQYGAIHDYDPLDVRLGLLATLFDRCDQPTADAFRRQQEIAQRFYRDHPEWIPKKEQPTNEAPE